MTTQQTAETGWLRAVPRDGSGYVGLIYGLVLVWGLGDVVSTYFAYAATGSVAAESNPWIAALLSHDPLLVLVLKAAVVLYAGVVLLACRGLVERVPGWRVWLSTIVTGGVLVVLGNLAVGINALV
jgi:hypothetical protein